MVVLQIAPTAIMRLLIGMGEATAQTVLILATWAANAVIAPQS